MTLALELLKRSWLPLLVVALLFFGAQGAYQAGKSAKDAEWLDRWNTHVAADELATSKAQAEQLAIQASREQTINKVTQDAQRQIDQANNDAADAAATASSLRDAIDQTVSRLADSQARVSACTTAASQAAARHARVLADVLKRADQRAGVLAATADQSRARGLACEAAYDGLEQQP